MSSEKELSFLQSFEKIFDRKIGEIQPVKIVGNYAKWTYSELAKCSSTNLFYTLTDKPDIEIKNPRNSADVVVNQISLIPDDNFKTLGYCKISVNESELVFQNKSLADFENVSELLLDFPKPIILKQHKSVKIFVRSSDGTEIKLTALIKLGEK